MKWQATHHDYPSTSWWTVDEVDDSGQIVRRIMDCGSNADLARRIAKLPELENLAVLVIAWQKSFVHGRDVTDEGFSVADEAAEQALYEAAKAAGKDGES